MSGLSFLAMLLQTITALAVVCGLAYFVFRFALPRLQTMNANRSMVRVVDRAGLEARKSLYVIEVAGRWLLIATSETGVHLVSELDAASAEESAAQLERLRSANKTFGTTGATFSDQLAKIMNKKR